MRRSGNIIFERAEGQTWQFQNFGTVPPSLNLYIANQLPASTMTIGDNDVEAGVYQYWIQLDNGAKNDPRIVNIVGGA